MIDLWLRACATPPPGRTIVDYVVILTPAMLFLLALLVLLEWRLRRCDG